MEQENEKLSKRWKVLDGRKGDLHERNQKYARWTLPYLYPEDGQKNNELDGDMSSTGARAVNHLSNKNVETLFPSYRPFLRLDIPEELRKKLDASGAPKEEIANALVMGEKASLKALDKMAHRTASVLALKYCIVTGNALLYYPEGSKVQVYNTRDFCIVRDLTGGLVELITRDTKKFETFADEVQEKLKGAKDGNRYKDDTDVTLYTRVYLKDDKYTVEQAADEMDLDTPDNQYAKKDLPWIPLTWNLTRGEDYGRGMVEDYKATFNAIQVLTQCLLEGAIVAGSIKFLVKPTSPIDVAELNRAPSGSYHSGYEGDITTVKSDKHLDLQMVQNSVDYYQREIAQAFLMHSEITRDAERVTAEEIQKDARELEIAYGGIYSRYTEEWQKPLAALLLTRQGITIGDDSIFPTIITGLDALSRLGDLDNYRLLMQDLSMIGQLPEPIQALMDLRGVVIFAGTNRGIDYSQFIKSEKQLAEEQAAAQQAQQQALVAETAAGVAGEAATQIAQEDS